MFLSSWPLNKAFFPLFILLGHRRMIFFCGGLLEGEIGRFCFVVLGTTSEYLFLHISLVMSAENIASLHMLTEGIGFQLI